MENDQTPRERYLTRLPLIIAGAIVVGLLIGYLLAGSDGKTVIARKSSEASKLRTLMHYIDRDYVDEVDLEKLTDDVIVEMLHELDPHSHYIPAKDLELADAELEGGFEGVGIEFSLIRDTIFVLTTISGGPAEQAGLQARDKIIFIEEELVAGQEIGNRGVIDRLRGEKGSAVKVKVQRKGFKELLPFTIVRDKIPRYSMEASYMIDEDIGYLKISHFSATTHQEFVDAVNDLKAQGMKKLIIDLQSNGGGYMDEATQLVDELLAGQKMIVYTKGKSRKFNQEIKAGKDGIFEEGPVIVLINENSASASEIVAGALQDHDRALIVGRRSFGKGLVQLGMELDDGSQVRLTISRYYTPSGRSIQRPYEEGYEAYSKEYISRYEHGEFFIADSIQFEDTLAFETEHGRTVYGGGGIMPDVFVPLDTSMNTPYLTHLLYSDALRTFMVDYREENKSALEDMGEEKYRAQFEVSEAVLQKVIDLAEADGIAFKPGQYQTSKSYLKTYIKSRIAHGIWGQETAMAIMNEENEILQAALKHFEKAAMLAKNE